METFYRIVWLFFCYSFLGWLGETGLTALRERRYVDKSLLYGPVCIVYGLAGVFITIAPSMPRWRNGWRDTGWNG